jgi:hypothetical protein
MLPQLIHIPKPCHEDWKKMPPTRKGAFCSSCQKEVLDFSNSSNAEINRELGKAKNPCIKISQHKIDELNFFEWFNHLNLRKRLKYVFLFAFLIAQNSLKAQESNCYEPQFVAVDSVDLLSEEDVMKEILNENEVAEPQASAWEWPEELFLKPSDFYYPIVTTGTIMGYVASPQTKKPEKGVPMFIGDVVDLNRTKNVEFVNEIVLAGNEYFFEIINDSIHLNYTIHSDLEITLKISQDQWGPSIYPNKNIVFFAPLKLSKGIGQLKYPIKNYPTGSYTFMLSQQNEVGVARLTKW